MVAELVGPLVGVVVVLRTLKKRGAFGGLGAAKGADFFDCLGVEGLHASQSPAALTTAVGLGQLLAALTDGWLLLELLVVMLAVL